jgi:hypothetical protein
MIYIILKHTTKKHITPLVMKTTALFGLGVVVLIS